MAQQITFDLSDLIGSEDGMRDEVARLAADALVKELRAEIKEEIKGNVSRGITTFIEGALKNVFDSTFTETDSYGNNRKGAVPKTLTEIVVEKALSHLNEMVDRDGGAGSYGTRDRTRLAYTAMKAADELIKKELQPEIEKAKAALVAQFKGQLALVFKEAVAAVVK